MRHHHTIEHTWGAFTGANEGRMEGGKEDGGQTELAMWGRSNGGAPSGAV